MEYEKVCVVCGARYKTVDPNRKCCSSGCGLAQGWIAKNNSRKHYPCIYCGKLFWKPNAYRLKFCSINCQKAMAAHIRKERQKNNPVPEKKLYHRACINCGKEFTTTRKHKKYCSGDCSYDTHLKRSREEYQDKYRARSFLCKECGSEVITEYRDNRSGFCCQSCADKFFKRTEHQSQRHKAYTARYKKIREQQIRKGFVEQVSYKKIYMRDKGVCQICGLQTPYNKSVDDSWGATIDHIVPLSRGGKHSMSNCQLAHRICNSLKSDSDYEGFHITWEEKARENNYWMKKYISYGDLMKEQSGFGDRGL